MRVAFVSRASNLAANDPQGFDVFVRDLRTNTTVAASVALNGFPAGSPGDFWGDCSPSMSADGRFVAFVSPSNQLVAGDTYLAYHVFIRDLETATTRRASLDSTGNRIQAVSPYFGPSISADGLFVAFAGADGNLFANDTNRAEDVFRFQTSVTTQTRTTVVATPKSSVYSQPVNLTASVTYDGGPVTEGTVSFHSGVFFTSGKRSRSTPMVEQPSPFPACRPVSLHTQLPRRIAAT